MVTYLLPGQTGMGALGEVPYEQWSSNPQLKRQAEDFWRQLGVDPYNVPRYAAPFDQSGSVVTGPSQAIIANQVSPSVAPSTSSGLRPAPAPTPLQRVLQGNPSASPSVLDYQGWLQRYGNSNGINKPAITLDQMLAENPGLTEELVSLYSTKMRGDYAAQNPQFQFSPGTFDLPSMASWNTVQQQGFNPQQLIYGNSGSSLANRPLGNRGVSDVTASPVGLANRATSYGPSAGRGVQTSPFNPTNTLNGLLQNRGGFQYKATPETGTTLDQILRQRQSGYLR